MGTGSLSIHNSGQYEAGELASNLQVLLQLLVCWERKDQLGVMVGLVFWEEKTEATHPAMMREVLVAHSLAGSDGVHLFHEQRITKAADNCMHHWKPEAKGLFCVGTTVPHI